MNTVHLPPKKESAEATFQRMFYLFQDATAIQDFLTVYITGRELLDLSVISQMNFVQSHAAEVYRHKKAH